MTAVPIEAADQARQALRVISTEHPDALSEPSLMASLLADLLPGAPRTARLIVAAVEDRIADQLREHTAQGLDPATASRLAAAAFAGATLLRPEACAWVVGEIAAAIGPTDDDSGPTTITAPRPGRQVDAPAPSLATERVGSPAPAAATGAKSGTPPRTEVPASGQPSGLAAAEAVAAVAVLPMQSTDPALPGSAVTGGPGPGGVS